MFFSSGHSLRKFPRVQQNNRQLEGFPYSLIRNKEKPASGMLGPGPGDEEADGVCVRMKD